jgi:hypothetical protein
MQRHCFMSLVMRYTDYAQMWIILALLWTVVARDYVEFPSQILERWFETPEVLSKFALHYKKRMNQYRWLVERTERSTFNSVSFLLLKRSPVH